MQIALQPLVSCPTNFINRRIIIPLNHVTFNNKNNNADNCRKTKSVIKIHNKNSKIVSHVAFSIPLIIITKSEKHFTNIRMYIHIHMYIYISLDAYMYVHNCFHLSFTPLYNMKTNSFALIDLSPFYLSKRSFYDCRITSYSV